MKIIIIFIIAFTSLNCQSYKFPKVDYPKGDKILFDEFTGLTTKRLLLYSLENHKEYEIPFKISNVVGVQDIHFSPNGNILMKTRHYNGIYIYNLSTCEVEAKMFPALDDRDKGSTSFKCINDTTIVLDGLYNLYIISINTAKILNKVAYNDTFWVANFNIISPDLLLINYRNSIDLSKDLPVKSILYNYKTENFVEYFGKIGGFPEYIRGADDIYFITEEGIELFNLTLRQTSIIPFEDINRDSIFYSNSKLIDKNRFLVMLMRGDFYKRDFYLYDFRDKSLKQLTDTKTEKNLIDVYCDRKIMKEN